MLINKIKGGKLLHELPVVDKAQCEKATTLNSLGRINEALTTFCITMSSEVNDYLLTSGLSPDADYEVVVKTEQVSVIHIDVIIRDMDSAEFLALNNHVTDKFNKMVLTLMNDDNWPTLITSVTLDFKENDNIGECDAI